VGYSRIKKRGSVSIGLVLAMKAEARALLGRGVWEAGKGEGEYPLRRVQLPGGNGGELAVTLSGVGIERAAAAAGFLADIGATALINIGISGALNPDMKAGDLVLASTVMDEDGAVFEVNKRLLGSALKIFEAASINVKKDLIISTKRPLLDENSKKKIYKETGALVVDMESAGVAAAAAKKGLPFFIMRLVSDEAGEAISPDLYAALDEKSGVIGPARLLGSCIRRPALVGEMMRLRRPYNLALSTMGRSWQTLLKGGFFSLPLFSSKS